MERISIKTETFDLKSFEESIMNFLINVGVKCDPYELVEVINSSVDYDEMADRDVRKELLNDMSTLYFPFSTSINDDGEVICANRKAYIVPDGNSGEEDEKQFYLTDTSNVGYLVAVNQGYLVVKSAKLASVAEGWVQEVENCGILDRPMNDYIYSFVF